jgi:hypothetical protein
MYAHRIQWRPLGRRQAAPAAEQVVIPPILPLIAHDAARHDTRASPLNTPALDFIYYAAHSILKISIIAPAHWPHHCTHLTYYFSIYRADYFFAAADAATLRRAMSPRHITE